MTPHGGQDAGVALIAVNGIELYYESHGTGAPLLVLGGLGLDVSEMGTLTGPLAARFRVIAADNRGAGRSAKPPGPAAHPARTTRRRGQRVPDGKRLTACRSPGCGPGTKPRVVTGATGRAGTRS
jgi:pimeloyl-ACP methyl ester carboxylesterase